MTEFKNVPEVGETIEFNTGRSYTPEGQIIEATIFGEYESLDFTKKERPEQYVIFYDRSRMIKGKLPYCPLDQKVIMDRYDKGYYESI